MIGIKERDALVSRVRAGMDRWTARQNGEDPSILLRMPADWYCPVVAAFTLRELNLLNVGKVHYQAGTCMWRRLEEKDDDGRPETLTHFSHIWNPDEARPHLIQGRLPELHCWAALEDNGVPWIVDVTTRSWPEKCKILTGMDWPGRLPPDYLWERADQVARAVYAPDLDACKVAFAFALSALEGSPLMVPIPNLRKEKV